eukprot:snap_masked-scaffold_4-processed-gene-18.28-mRNA-1 protein AED:0.34 eAED:0.35 QI:0/-1/0/1/-1/1/1/0/1166
MNNKKKSLQNKFPKTLPSVLRTHNSDASEEFYESTGFEKFASTRVEKENTINVSGTKGKKRSFNWRKKSEARVDTPELLRPSPEKVEVRNGYKSDSEVLRKNVPKTSLLTEEVKSEIFELKEEKTMTEIYSKENIYKLLSSGERAETIANRIFSRKHNLPMAKVERKGKTKSLSAFPTLRKKFKFFGNENHNSIEDFQALQQTKNQKENTNLVNLLNKNPFGLAAKLPPEYIPQLIRFGFDGSLTLSSVPTEKISQSLKVHYCREIARILSKLHDNDHTLGTLDQENVFLGRNMDVGIFVPQTIDRVGGNSQKRKDVTLLLTLIVGLNIRSVSKHSLYECQAAYQVKEYMENIQEEREMTDTEVSEDKLQLLKNILASDELLLGVRPLTDLNNSEIPEEKRNRKSKVVITADGVVNNLVDKALEKLRGHARSSQISLRSASSREAMGDMDESYAVPDSLPPLDDLEFEDNQDLAELDPETIGKMLDKQEKIDAKLAVAIVHSVTNLLKEEPNIISLNVDDTTVEVYGDIHGQYFDLRNMIQFNPSKTYLFLGDYVDRGKWSCEVLLYLLCLKLKYPDRIWLLRGNHETRSVSSYFGFKVEATRKFGSTFFNRSLLFFRTLPLAALVTTPGGRWLCLHGGISPNVTHLDQFKEFDRFKEPELQGFLCDVLWSDPAEDNIYNGNTRDFMSVDYLPNPVRGCSYRYGFRALLEFQIKNNLAGILRAHEVQEQGFKVHYGRLLVQQKDARYPIVVTVFSAPNYCGRYGNKGAKIVMQADKFPQENLLGKEKKNRFGIVSSFVSSMLQCGNFGRVKLDRLTPSKSSRRIKIDSPLDYLKPLQYSSVNEPLEMLRENEEYKQQANIESLCPYMPTTIAAFIYRALDLASMTQRVVENKLQEENSKPQPSVASMISVDEEFDDAGSISSITFMNVDKIPPASATLGRNKSADTEKLRNRKKKDATTSPSQPKNWKALQLLGLDKGVDLSPAPAQKKSSKKKLRTSLRRASFEDFGGSVISVEDDDYKSVKSFDSINEMNPLLVSQKMKFARKELRKPSLNSLKRTRHKKKTDTALSFEKDEIVALRTLFMFVDRDSKGGIDAESLMTWVEEQDVDVKVEDCLICIEAVDYDGDGVIGFDDYLIFAAKNKKEWLEDQYKQVIETLKKLEARKGS